MSAKDLGYGDVPLKENGRHSGPIREGDKTFQYIAAFAATLGAFTIGTILSWTSPALQALQANVTSNVSSILEEPLTKSEGAWVGSLIAVGALAGALPAGILCDKIGRKWTILGLGVPFILSWVLIAFARSVALIYVARILAGVATGGSSVAIPMYIGETAENSVRGALGSFFQLLLVVGILFSYLVGSLVDYTWLAILSGAVPVIFMVVFFFMPETPIYLVKKHRTDEATKSLLRLRGPHYDVKSELEMLEDEIAESQRNKASIRDLFASRANINGLTVGLALMMFQQLSGVNAVIFYTADIFQAAGSTLDANVCAVIVGVVQVVVTIIATLLVDKAGRKILLLISSSVMCICLVVLGVYFHLQSQDPEQVKSIGWLPLAAVNIFIVTFSLGFGPLPWMMMSEIFSSSIKGVASSIAVTLNWTLTFIVTRTFSDLVESIGIAATFWIFSAITGLGVLFVIFRVPETKGKTFAEIQRDLGGK